MSFGSDLDAKGWQAGAVVAQDMMPLVVPLLARAGLAPPDVGRGDWLVVVSQTCDVVAAKEDAEPLLEILHCRPVEKLRAEFQGRKSTRRLDLRPNKDEHPAVVLSAHAIADRYEVPRALFMGHEPDHQRSLSANAVTNVQAWYSLRYTRPAWPDAFNERWAPVKKALLKVLDPLKEDVAEVRVAILERDDELAAGSDYHVTVFFVVDDATWSDDPQARLAAQAAFAEFFSALGNCDGIDVDKDLSDVLPGGVFSWQLTRSTDERNFANLSHQE